MWRTETVPSAPAEETIVCVRVYLGLHAVILREKGLQGMPGDHNCRLERRAHERVQGFLSFAGMLPVVLKSFP